MEWILFFDGDCAFCSAAVRRLAKLDRRVQIAFASLQGELARQKGLSRFVSGGPETMVLLRLSDGRMFTHSDGWIELANALGGGWRVLTILRLVPRCWRDGVYRWVAHHRHRFKCRTNACRPADDLESRPPTHP